MDRPATRRKVHGALYQQLPGCDKPYATAGEKNGHQAALCMTVNVIQIAVCWNKSRSG